MCEKLAGRTIGARRQEYLKQLSQSQHIGSRGRLKCTTMATIVRKLISTVNAPKPVAPYNQAVVADRTVYVSGCLGSDKVTSKLVEGGIAEQTAQALENLKNVLEAANSGLDKVVKTTVFMKDMDHFASMNEVYKKVFSHDCPARSAFQVARLPMDALVEIECIALTGDVKTVSS